MPSLLLLPVVAQARLSQPPCRQHDHRYCLRLRLCHRRLQRCRCRRRRHHHHRLCRLHLHNHDNRQHPSRHRLRHGRKHQLDRLRQPQHRHRFWKHQRHLVWQLHHGSGRCLRDGCFGKQDRHCNCEYSLIHPPFPIVALPFPSTYTLLVIVQLLTPLKGIRHSNHQSPLEFHRGRLTLRLRRCGRWIRRLLQLQGHCCPGHRWRDGRFRWVRRSRRRCTFVNNNIRITR